MPQSTLRTRRLSLKPLQAEDRQDLYALDKHPKVMRYIYTGKPLTDEEAALSFDTLLDIAKTDEGLGCWVGHDGRGNFVGWWVIATSPPADEPVADPSAQKDSRSVEIGMRIAPRYWNQGYAKEGLQALLEHSFVDLDKSQVYGETMTVNTGCRALMEKCGMAHVRTWHNTYDSFTPAPGIEEGEVEHRITREQWMSNTRVAMRV